jgi:uncharacterized glyoxalase superfamily protein PhnB
VAVGILTDFNTDCDYSRVIVYIMVDNIDELWYSIKDKAEVCSEIETFEWGMREFAIFDNNGYSFQFAQDMTQFL